MQNDEEAIRQLVAQWLAASKSGDIETVLTLMADDVIFLVPGTEPFGREAFAAYSRQMKGARLDGTSEIQEIKILGDWAWMRNFLTLSFTSTDGKTIFRSGYTLTILRKNAGGNWVIFRDANLMTTKPEK